MLDRYSTTELYLQSPSLMFNYSLLQLTSLGDWKVSFEANNFVCVCVM